MNEYTEVPILARFDNTKVIGWVKILTSELPNSPDFVFSLGFKALEMGKVTTIAGIHNGPYTGTYELLCTSIVTDDQYLQYLKQIGKA